MIKQAEDIINDLCNLTRQMVSLTLSKENYLSNLKLVADDYQVKLDKLLTLGLSLDEVLLLKNKSKSNLLPFLTDQNHTDKLVILDYLISKLRINM